jgi:hypothetical protein
MRSLPDISFNCRLKRSISVFLKLFKINSLKSYPVKATINLRQRTLILLSSLLFISNSITKNADDDNNYNQNNQS